MTNEIPSWPQLLRRAWRAFRLWRTPLAPACADCGFPMTLVKAPDPCRPIRWGCSDCAALSAELERNRQQQIALEEERVYKRGLLGERACVHVCAEYKRVPDPTLGGVTHVFVHSIPVATMVEREPGSFIPVWSDFPRANGVVVDGVQRVFIDNVRVWE